MIKEILQINNYVDGINDVPFFSSDEPIVITEYEFNANRMGSISVSATFRHKAQLDDLWDGTQYVTIRGHRCFIKNVPTSSKDNKDERYKYQIDFVSKRSMLDTVYFFDVVTDDTPNDQYHSNSTNVVFFGDLNEFVKRANYSLNYSNVSYSVVIDNDVVTEGKQFSFDNMYMSDALRNAFEVWGIPFYFVGDVIHFGYSENTLQIPIAYGHDRELLQITKTNSQSAIINRCSGKGSTDNIPYYYPNESDDRASIEAGGGKWITPCQNLMPSIYRESKGAERFYSALNDTYPSSGGFLVFENTYNGNNPKEHIQDFPEIRPSFEGATNSAGVRMDEIVRFAYDKDDNDDVDEKTGDFKHPYFYAQLRRMDGTFGFNIFDHAIAGNSPMTISMKSGNCASCNFEIGVLESTKDGVTIFENPVQVDDFGNIVDGNYEDKVKLDNIQPQQQDTYNNEVWIALKKDNSTYGTLMPNASNNYRPSAFDRFVILYIELPQVYITSAESRLDSAILDFLVKNNSNKFNFSVNFSRVYFAEHRDVLKDINENSILLIQYNNQQYELFISSFSYKASDSSPLPEIRVELTDTLTISKNAIQQAVDKVSGGYNGYHSDGNYNYDNKYIRKDRPDWTKYRVGFYKGATFGTFVGGMTGSGAFIDERGNEEAESLKLRSFLQVPEFRFNRINVINGEQWAVNLFGTIKYVDTEKKIIELDLVDDELSGMTEDVIGGFCRGIFHNLDKNESAEGTDDGNFDKIVGFSTSFFTPIEIIDNSHFKYALKEGTNVEPCPFMKFVMYGHPTNELYQKSTYTTPTYSRILTGVDTWAISPKNISLQQGDLSNLTVNNQSLKDGSIYLNSVYFGGNIEFVQGVDNPWLGKDAYSVILSSYSTTYKRGDQYPSTYLQVTKGTTRLTASNVATEGHYILTSVDKVGCDYEFDEASGKISITSLTLDSASFTIRVNCEGNATYDLEYNITRIFDGTDGDEGEDSYSVTLSEYSVAYKDGDTMPSTKLQVFKGSTRLVYSDTAVNGFYSLGVLNAVGCSFEVDTNSEEIRITEIRSEKSYVDIPVNCEGLATYTLRYNIVKVKDGSDAYMSFLSSYSVVYKDGITSVNTKVFAYKGSTRLTSTSNNYPTDGEFSVSLTKHSCDATFNVADSELEMYNMTSNKSSVDVDVNCENKLHFDMVFSAEKVMDGEDGLSVLPAYRVTSEEEGTPSAPTSTTYPPSGGWGQDPPASEGILWMSKAKVDENNNVVGSWSTPIRINGKDGAQGKKAPMLVNRGVFREDKRYIGSEDRCDVVSIDEGINGNHDIKYYFAKETAGTFYGEGNIPMEGSPKWEKFKVEAPSIASGLAFFERASIAGWWFENSYIYSDKEGVLLNGNNDDLPKFSAGIPTGTQDIKDRSKEALTRIYDDGSFVTKRAEIGVFNVSSLNGYQLTSGDVLEKRDYMRLSANTLEMKSTSSTTDKYGYFSLSSYPSLGTGQDENVPILKIWNTYNGSSYPSAKRNVAMDVRGDNTINGSMNILRRCMNITIGEQFYSSKIIDNYRYIDTYMITNRLRDRIGIVRLPNMNDMDDYNITFILNIVGSHTSTQEAIVCTSSEDTWIKDNNGNVVSEKSGSGIPSSGSIRIAKGDSLTLLYMYQVYYILNISR